MLCTVAEPTSDLPTRALVSKRNAYVRRFCLLELGDYNGSIFKGEGEVNSKHVVVLEVARLDQRCMHAYIYIYIPQTMLALEGVLTCVSFFPSFLPSFLPFFLSFFPSFLPSFLSFFLSFCLSFFFLSFFFLFRNRIIGGRRHCGQEGKDPGPPIYIAALQDAHAMKGKPIC